ncbi:molybdopterin oxidoreductase, partial [bacterium CG17_big_fil_post_rev_8_21_14_2_50_64_8]
MSDSSQKRDFWRSLDELAAGSEFSRLQEQEFPGGIEAPDDMSRRRFLQIMGASAALATLAGCRWPEEKIMPYAQRPEGTDPGTPRQFATTFEMGPVALPVLATSYDGRPIKIDGNPEVPLSGGATNV